MTPPDSDEKSCCDPATWDDFAKLNELQCGAVLLPLSLAQRILAAIEKVPWGARSDELDAIAAELRERIKP